MKNIDLFIKTAKKSVSEKIDKGIDNTAKFVKKTKNKAIVGIDKTTKFVKKHKNRLIGAGIAAGVGAAARGGYIKGFNEHVHQFPKKFFGGRDYSR